MIPSFPKDIRDCQVAYVAGQASRDARHPSPKQNYTDTELQYFWRGWFDLNGTLSIYGLIKGTGQLNKDGYRVDELQDMAAPNHGPRATVKGKYSGVVAFLEYLESEECIFAEAPALSYGHSEAQDEPERIREALPDSQGVAAPPRAQIARRASIAEVNSGDGLMKFNRSQAIALCKILYDDENIKTEPRNMHMADKIIKYQRVRQELTVA